MLSTESRKSKQGPARQVRIGCAGWMAAAAVASGLVGCSSDSGVDTEDPVAAATSASPSATLTPASDNEPILAAYREFFAAQTRISSAPAGERRVMLEPLATDPALSRVLRGMFAADELGEVGYGQEVLDPRVTNVDGDDAEIEDCQDTSGIGRKKRDNGKIVTRGTPEADVRATMRRGADGSWRVATVEYKDAAC